MGYAHDHGVRVHVTVNTSLRNQEMSEAVSFVRFLRDIDADAVLIQDLGLLRAVQGIDIPTALRKVKRYYAQNSAAWGA